MHHTKVMNYKIHDQKQEETGMTAKKDIDWGNLGFAYHVTDKRYVSMYQDGKWESQRTENV